MSTELITQPQVTQTLMKPIATPKELISYHEDMTRIIREALKEGTDYGVIPGTKKPTLYKPGAERINIAFGTHPEYELIDHEIDHDREVKWSNNYKSGIAHGLYRYVYKCRIVRNADGSVIGEGQGVCSTLEAKYVSRPRDSENTACKMSQKRAFMAATLHAFGLSDRFTQDMEDTVDTRALQHSPQTVAELEASIAERRPAPAPLLFNVNDLAHLDKLSTVLVGREVPADKHLDIANAMHGKPFNKAELEAHMKSLRKIIIEAEETV